jgi:hypothetical protein
VVLGDLDLLENELQVAGRDREALTRGRRSSLRVGSELCTNPHDGGKHAGREYDDAHGGGDPPGPAQDAEPHRNAQNNTYRGPSRVQDIHV